jgi:hypothetical protein
VKHRSLVLLLTSFQLNCGLFQVGTQTPAATDSATCTRGEPGCPTAKERIEAAPCAELPEAAYAFQAQGGGAEDREVDEAVEGKLKSCGKWADLFTGRPWRFDNQVNVSGAQTPEGEKALRALLLAKKREELIAISKWLDDLVHPSNDAGPDFSSELAATVDTLPPSTAVLLYLARKKHPMAAALVKERLSSTEPSTRIAACRAVVDIETPELVAEAENLAQSDPEVVWKDTPSGEHIVRTYPVREMCTLSVQIVQGRRAEAKGKGKK